MTTDKQKLTVHIDGDEYYNFTKNLYHGQLTLIVQKFIKVINELKVDGKGDTFTSWVHGNKNLTLKQPKKKGT